MTFDPELLRERRDRVFGDRQGAQIVLRREGAGL
jgi:hypothetical protein